MDLERVNFNEKEGRMWMSYLKTASQEMRPYVPGEDLTSVSVNAEDTPELGGMIARNADNHKDQWYVGKEFFEKNYVISTESPERFVCLGQLDKGLVGKMGILYVKEG